MYTDADKAAAYSKEYNRQRRKHRKEQGVCQACGEAPAAPRHAHCSQCLSAISTRVAVAKRARQDAGLCVRCGFQLDKTSGNSTCPACVEKSLTYQRKWRQQVLDHYGRRCACCGESNELFLTIDHMDNDGSSHRKEIGQSAIYRWLVRHNFPERFQTLCYNCNLGKRVNNGVCPHLNSQVV